MYLNVVLEKGAPNFQFDLFYPQHTFQQVMFKKSSRVQKQLFPHILKKGKVYYSKHFTLRIVQKQGNREGKVSFVVSKKVERSAVRRNQLKRRLYHALKENLVVLSSFIGVFFVKKGAHLLSFSDIKNELAELLESAKISKDAQEGQF